MAHKKSFILTPTGQDINLADPQYAGITLFYIDNTSGGNLRVLLWGDQAPHTIMRIPSGFYILSEWLAVKTILDSGTSVDEIIGYR